MFQITTLEVYFEVFTNVHVQIILQVRISGAVNLENVCDLLFFFRICEPQPLCITQIFDFWVEQGIILKAYYLKNHWLKFHALERQQTKVMGQEANMATGSDFFQPLVLAPVFRLF